MHNLTLHKWYQGTGEGVLVRSWLYKILLRGTHLFVHLALATEAALAPPREQRGSGVKLSAGSRVGASGGGQTPVKFLAKMVHFDPLRAILAINMYLT